MKTILKVSVLLNAILVGVISLHYVHPRTVTIPAPEAPTMAAKVEPQPLSARAVQTVLTPFRWSQLVSTNGFLTFVANLRASGCPESTVEDIVQGDTGRAYSVMRERLGLKPADPGAWSAQAQAQMVAYFLGQAPAPTLNVTPPPLPLLVATPPLVLQGVDLLTLKLDDAQTQAIANIRETFWKSVGGQNQDTHDPAYLARWQKAQGQADNMLQAMLGEQAFAQYQIKAYQMSLQNQVTPSRN